jgi:peptidoglycan/xylan/chitin deacetylase (PgdA/CDA1 family)
MNKIGINWFRCIILLISYACTSGSADNKESPLIKNDKEIVCFVYHRFNDARFPSTNTSLKDFEAHLVYLLEQKFQVLSFSQAIEYMQSDEATKKTAVITIDDGYKSFYKNALPLLKKYKVPATLFINTQTIGAGDYMNWNELKECIDHNIEIGNHTHSHKYFLNEKPDTRYKTFKEELEVSQSLIQQNLEVLPDVFAYPYGEFDLEMKKIVREAGFRAAAAQNSGIIYYATDLYQCPRFPMSEAYSALSKFIEKASTQPLKIIRTTPDNFLLPSHKRPLLTLSFEREDLVLKQLQCFVQGNGCDLRIIEQSDSLVTVTIQATQTISARRRTLYTITVPDKQGAWHWYSHLWINEKIH